MVTGGPLTLLLFFQFVQSIHAAEVIVAKICNDYCRYDFYLVSQCVREGTVAPTSYNVIDDSSGLSPDQVRTCLHQRTFYQAISSKSRNIGKIAYLTRHCHFLLRLLLLKLLKYRYTYCFSVNRSTLDIETP